jgi:4-hydroxythreonine-4-phosphate dehydrogenase
LLRILIVADDLSGAADCGVACVGAGLETLVALKHSADDPEADVLSFDMDTRRMPPDQAQEEVARLIRFYAADPTLLLFKKVDSTLRGNVGQELAAALSALRSVASRGVAPRGDRGQNQCKVAIMAPAFPAIGRTTINGTQFVHGQPLHDLDIWRIQGMKGKANIADMLQPARLKSAVLDLAAIRSTQEVLAGQMNTIAREADVLVCDAETDDDLLAIASASMRLDCKPLWVGSAGLAYQLPRAAGLDARLTAAPIKLPHIRGPHLFVIGSLSRNSLEQVRVLASLSNTVRICVSPEILLAGEQHSNWQTHAHELERAIRSGHDAVLTPNPEPCIDLAQRPLIAAALARMASAVSTEIGALVASGGETARAVFDSLGITRLRLLGELEKGIPVSLTESWTRPLPVITKAGDFGGANSLLKCSQFLHSVDPHFVSMRESRLELGKVIE